MVPSIGELKSAIEESLVCLWRQWNGLNQRLLEARQLVKSQRSANKRVKGEGSKPTQPARGKKKVVVVVDY